MIELIDYYKIPKLNETSKLKIFFKKYCENYIYPDDFSAFTYNELDFNILTNHHKWYLMTELNALIRIHLIGDLSFKKLIEKMCFHYRNLYLSPQNE